MDNLLELCSFYFQKVALRLKHYPFCNYQLSIN